MNRQLLNNARNILHQNRDLLRHKINSESERIRSLYLSDSAQVGPIVVFVLAFVMLAVYWIIISPMIDQVINVHNSYNGTTIVYSQERSAGIGILKTAFDAYLIFAVIVLVIWLLIQSLREREGNVW